MKLVASLKNDVSYSKMWKYSIHNSILYCNWLFQNILFTKGNLTPNCIRWQNLGHLKLSTSISRIIHMLKIISGGCTAWVWNIVTFINILKRVMNFCCVSLNSVFFCAMNAASPMNIKRALQVLGVKTLFQNESICCLHLFL